MIEAEQTTFNSRLRKRLAHSPWLATCGGSLLALLLTGAILRWMGRLPWCACEKPNLWVQDVLSSHLSQHLFDPYSVTHLLHGFLLCGFLALVASKYVWQLRLCMAILLECGWEMLENSKMVIDRYRTATAAFGYKGDSIANSLGDVISCTLGFLVARYLGLKRGLIVFLLTEIVLLFWIKDGLILNIIMLICPIEAIKSWQLGH